MPKSSPSGKMEREVDDSHAILEEWLFWIRHHQAGMRDGGLKPSRIRHHQLGMELGVQELK